MIKHTAFYIQMHLTSFLKEKNVCFTHLTCQISLRLKRMGVLERRAKSAETVRVDEGVNIETPPH